MIDFGVEMRAGDNVQFGIGLARLLHDLTGLEGIGNGDHQPARGGQIGGGDNLELGAVAFGGLETGRAGG